MKNYRLENGVAIDLTVDWNVGKNEAELSLKFHRAAPRPIIRIPDFYKARGDGKALGDGFHAPPQDAAETLIFNLRGLFIKPCEE